MGDRDFDAKDGGYICVMNEFIDKLITYRMSASEWLIVMPSNTFFLGYSGPALGRILMARHPRKDRPGRCMSVPRAKKAKILPDHRNN